MERHRRNGVTWQQVGVLLLLASQLILGALYAGQMSQRVNDLTDSVRGIQLQILDIERQHR